MIGQKHPEFKQKMFDLASLYDVLDTALTKSRQFDATLVRKFIDNALKVGGIGGAVGAAYLLVQKIFGGNSQQRSFGNINSIGSNIGNQ